MYKLNPIEEMEYNSFCFMIDNKGLYPYIRDDKLFILLDSEIIFSKDVDKLSIVDINNILNTSLMDSKYIYYLINKAEQNVKIKCKKKKHYDYSLKSLVISSSMFFPSK